MKYLDVLFYLLTYLNIFSKSIYASVTELSLPNTTKKWYTAENDQELIDIFEHKICTFYIHL